MSLETCVLLKDIGCFVGKLIAFVSDAETLPILNRVADSKTVA
jgi:hypothetical protein